MSQSETHRLTAPPWLLVKEAMGGSRMMTEKLKKLMVAVWMYGRADQVEPRLRRLKHLGYIDNVPNRIQRMIGAVDMLRFFIVPCAADYYDAKGINFRFHTLLRFLDDPASVIDPTGFNSTRDAIIGHVMQVVHANPHYDFQLLESFEDGLEEMEAQVRQVLDGTHPRAEAISAIVEDPDYHQRLLEHIQAYRANHGIKPLLRDNISNNPKFERVERTFGTVPAAIRYFSKMPKTLRGGLSHLRRVRTFPAELVH